jgi:hypothetical protein
MGCRAAGTTPPPPTLCSVRNTVLLQEKLDTRCSLDRDLPAYAAKPAPSPARAGSVSAELVRALSALGVEMSFGVIGGAISQLCHALDQSAIAYLHFRHETGRCLRRARSVARDEEAHGRLHHLRPRPHQRAHRHVRRALGRGPRDLDLREHLARAPRPRRDAGDEREHPALERALPLGPALSLRDLDRAPRAARRGRRRARAGPSPQGGLHRSHQLAHRPARRARASLHARPPRARAPARRRRRDGEPSTPISSRASAS